MKCQQLRPSPPPLNRTLTHGDTQESFYAQTLKPVLDIEAIKERHCFFVMNHFSNSDTMGRGAARQYHQLPLSGPTETSSHLLYHGASTTPTFPRGFLKDFALKFSKGASERS